jgi:adenylylsulfate kinase-like enzyme
VIPVLWLCGPPGVGKSEVAGQLYTQLVGERCRTAYVDIDQLGICYPERSEDPGRHHIKRKNLASVVQGFASTGAQSLIVSGVLDVSRGGEVYALPRSVVTIGRLRADAGELSRRVEGRHGSFAHLDDALREAEALDDSDFAEFCLDTTGLSIAEVVQAVRGKIGDWPNPGTGAGAESVPPADDTHLASDGPILWLSGPTGVGKSTIGFAVYRRILATGLMAAYVDIDQIGFCPNGDDHAMRSQILASLWRTYRSAGASALVVVGPVHDRFEAAMYECALPQARFTWCRLGAGGEELTRRILSRRAGGSWPQPGDPLKGQPTRRLLEIAQTAIREAQQIETMGVGTLIDTDGQTIDQAAQLIITRLRWPGDQR